METRIACQCIGTEVNATKFGPGCGQLVTLGLPIPWSSPPFLPSSESEDCLSLNIWAPRDGKHLPILVFAPGGGYLIGTSSSPIYDGHHIAKTGRAIFVSLYYRLDIWGFPSTTPIPGEIDQNVGITDSRLAVEWVAKNIAQLGGDPSRIIIAGHSAGAHLFNTHVYAYEKNPIAAGQIAASGAIGMFPSAPADGVFWNNISDILGCGNTTNSSQVSK
jgi:carboxylesterase type B